MQIKIKNEFPNVKVDVKEHGNGDITVTLSEQPRRTLGEVKCGEIVKLGDREFYVLEHSATTTAVLAKDSVKTMDYAGGGDYAKSDVRRYLNDTFYNELSNAVGASNIVEHTIKLVADDGTGKKLSVRDHVSLLTTDLYRRYREYLPAMGSPWWTATRVTHDESTGYARCVCCVHSNGILGWFGCDCGGDVRPFCVLDSSIFVS